MERRWLAALAVAAATLGAASLPLLAKSRKIEIGHTGLTWIPLGGPINPPPPVAPMVDPQYVKKAITEIGGLGFRGLELFGQQANRLEEPGYRKVVAQCGVIVVEGLNDVVGLDNIGIPAVAICSNRITQAQVEKIVRWSQQLANGKVTLLFDCEPTGDDGAKEALWQLTQRGLQVRLGWTQSMHGGVFHGRQPENLSLPEWQRLLGTASSQ